MQLVTWTQFYVRSYAIRLLANMTHIANSVSLRIWTKWEKIDLKHIAHISTHPRTFRPVYGAVELTLAYRCRWKGFRNESYLFTYISMLNYLKFVWILWRRVLQRNVLISLNGEKRSLVHDLTKKKTVILNRILFSETRWSWALTTTGVRLTWAGFVRLTWTTRHCDYIKLLYSRGQWLLEQICTSLPYNISFFPHQLVDFRESFYLSICILINKLFDSYSHEASSTMFEMSTNNTFKCSCQSTLPLLLEHSSKMCLCLCVYRGENLPKCREQPILKIAIQTRLRTHTWQFRTKLQWYTTTFVHKA